MKLKFILLALVAIIPTVHVLHADILNNDKVTVTGSIIQETGTNGTTKILPVTIANVLSVLGITGTNAPAANTLRYYNDGTTNGTVIAPKVLAVSGSGTPIVTLGGPGNTGASWNPSNHSSIGAGDAIGMNGNLTGTYFESGVYPHSLETDRINAVLYGTIAGLPTIMKITIVDSHNNSN